jgi:hypothetical protein
MTDSATYTLYISNDAFDELVLQARMLGYSHGTETAKGLSKYIAFLMTCDMHDARPDYIREQDIDLLRSGASPEWRLYTPRVRRKVKLSTQTIVEGAAHAFRLGIAYPSIMHVQGAPSLADATQCMSALLEAIGTEWVSPKVRQDDGT